MRLVRGSILSSKPCSTSQAARILRKFLSSDEGTDVFVKSFLTRAARSLESMQDGGHSSKNKNRRFDPQTPQEFENPDTPRNPVGGISGLEHPEQATGSKILGSGKHEKEREKSYLEGLTTEKNEVGSNPSEEKSHKKLRKTHGLEGGKSEVDSDLYITPSVEKSEKLRRENGTISTSMDIKEVNTEKRRKKGVYKENHEHDDFGIKLDSEVMETSSTPKKKSKKSRSNDQGTQNEDADMIFSSSKRSEQGKRYVSEVKEVDQKHHSKRRVLETEAEVIADGQEFPSIKKRRKDKTPK